MCIRTIYYLVCTDCNNQFVDPKWGAHFGSEEEITPLAIAQGWHLAVMVENGSFWDFCPRCFRAANGDLYAKVSGESKGVE